MTSLPRTGVLPRRRLPSCLRRSSWDTVPISLVTVVPLVAQSLIRGRLRIVALAERVAAVRLLASVLRRMGRKYGSGPPPHPQEQAPDEFASDHVRDVPYLQAWVQQTLRLWPTTVAVPHAGIGLGVHRTRAIETLARGG
jgi:hypothetical protein